MVAAIEDFAQPSNSKERKYELHSLENESEDDQRSESEEDNACMLEKLGTFWIGAVRLSESKGRKRLMSENCQRSRDISAQDG